MSAYKSDFLNVLAERGFIHQVSEPDALDQLAKSQPITAYIGFDCTAASLHIGSLLPIMMLHWLQETGHRPIALMGGGTTRVGDPSGKDESRRILTDEIINENLKGIRAIFSRFLKFEGAGGNAIMANNADWLNTLNYIDFLRDVGRHFSINRMLSFDSVKMRLDRQQELSFLEFNYMILQAYDFVELNKRTGCVLQMGGSDQWGQYRQRHRPRPPHARSAVVCADCAADHDKLGREDGQDRGRRGVAQRWHGEPVRLLAILAQHRGRRRPCASSSCSPSCRLTRSRALRLCRARRSTRRRRCSRPRRRRWCMAAPRPMKRQTPRARPSRKARSPKTSRLSQYRNMNANTSSDQMALRFLSRLNWRDSPNQPAKRGVISKGVALKVNDETVTSIMMMLNLSTSLLKA